MTRASRPPFPGLTHVEITMPMGDKLVMTWDAYSQLPDEAVANTIARPITRAQAVARRARVRGAS